MLLPLGDRPLLVSWPFAFLEVDPFSVEVDLPLDPDPFLFQPVIHDDLSGGKVVGTEGIELPNGE